MTAERPRPPGPFHDWHGQMVAYGGEDPDPAGATYRDLDMNDFSDLVDWLSLHGTFPRPHMFPPGGDNRAEGVRINCLGDVTKNHRPVFEQSGIGLNDSIFAQNNAPGPFVSELVDFPIIARQIPRDWEAVGSDKEDWFDKTADSNEAAEVLFQCCDPQAGPDPSTGALGWG